MAAGAPCKIIRECDRLLDGKVKQTPEQFQRWVVRQIKFLAISNKNRYMENMRMKKGLSDLTHEGVIDDSD